MIQLISFHMFTVSGVRLRFSLNLLSNSFTLMTSNKKQLKCMTHAPDLHYNEINKFLFILQENEKTENGTESDKTEQSTKVPAES